MRILICDDDTLIIEQLQKYIESYFESNHLKCPELVSFTSCLLYTSPSPRDRG